MSKLQRGFTLVEALVVILVVVAVGFSGWRVFHNKSTATPGSLTKTSDLKEITTSEIPKGWVIESRLCYTFYLPAKNDLPNLDGCGLLARYNYGSDGVSMLIVSPFKNYDNSGHSYAEVRLPKEVSDWKKSFEGGNYDYQVKGESDFKLDGKLAHQIVYSSTGNLIVPTSVPGGKSHDYAAVFVDAGKTYEAGGYRTNGFTITGPYSISDGDKDQFDKIIATWRWK